MPVHQANLPDGADKSKQLDDFHDSKPELKPTDDAVEPKPPSEPPDEDAIEPKRLTTKPPDDSFESETPTIPRQRPSLLSSPPAERFCENKQKIQNKNTYQMASISRSNLIISATPSRSLSPPTMPLSPSRRPSHFMMCSSHGLSQLTMLLSPNRRPGHWPRFTAQLHPTALPNPCPC